MSFVVTRNVRLMALSGPTPTYPLNTTNNTNDSLCHAPASRQEQPGIQLNGLLD